MPDLPPRLHAVVDRAGRLIEADPALAEMNRRAGGDDRLMVAGLAALVQRAVTTGTPVVALQAVALDDRMRRYWARLVPDEGGIGIDLVACDPGPATDIPPQPLSERDFTRVGADWLWEVDAALHVTAMSESAVGLFGVPIELMIGQPITRLLVLVAPGGRAPLVEAIRLGRPLEAQIAEIDSHPEQGRFLLSAALVTGADGEVLGLRGTAVAIPLDLASTPDDAGVDTPSDEIASGLSPAGLAQTLGGPIAAIVEAAEAMETQRFGPLRRVYADYAAHIADAGRMLSGLVADMTEADRIENGALAVEFGPVDLGEAAHRAVALLGLQAERKGIGLDVDPVPAFGQVFGDRHHILQILVNLIGNAVKFSPASSTIRIRADAGGLSARGVAVEDEGPGIAEADRKRVFDKFERLGAGGEGVGLGLYIARGMARAMAGDLEVEAAPGGGARFLLSLPSA